MAEWAAKRFWTKAEVQPEGEGWTVTLDGKPVRTPGKHPLIVPTQALALAIAAEWDAQEGVIRPETMPLTRAANSAIEKVTPQFDAVAEMLAAYGGSDLLCYRAEGPAALAAQQAAAWDPLLDWARDDLDAPLRPTAGVMHVAQDEAALARLERELKALDLFGLTAVHDLVTLPGSLVLGLAVLKGRLSAEEAYQLSRIDEEFQAEAWGRDEEADEAAAGRLAAMRSAEQLWKLSRP